MKRRKVNKGFLKEVRLEILQKQKRKSSISKNNLSTGQKFTWYRDELICHSVEERDPFINSTIPKWIPAEVYTERRRSAGMTKKQRINM